MKPRPPRDKRTDTLFPLPTLFRSGFDRDLAGVPDCLLAFHPEQTGPRRVQFRYHASESPVPQILEAVYKAGLAVVDMSTEETDLEDIFLQLTRGAHDTAGDETAGGTVSGDDAAA